MNKSPRAREEVEHSSDAYGTSKGEGMRNLLIQYGFGAVLIQHGKAIAHA